MIAKEKFKPDLFLYENNVSADKSIKDEIRLRLGATDPTDLWDQDNGVRYIEINSALVSAQQRKRFYVHNCGEVGQPEDRGILLKDILETDGNMSMDRWYELKNVCEGKGNQTGDVGSKAQAQRVYSSDGKSVTINAGAGRQGGKTGVYEDGRLVGIDTFLVSYQNSEADRELSDSIVKGLALDAIGKHSSLPRPKNFLINPSGRFKLGGFDADAGLTGRKIVVDSYQGFAPVGGGCMNGKDPTKVDFSAAHMARRLACESLGGFRSVTVQLAYAIGKAEPVSVTFRKVGKDGSVSFCDGSLEQYARCTPASMRKELDLDNFDYVDAAAFGHFNDVE